MSEEITRDVWVDAFDAGFRLGAKERKRQPEDRRENVTDLKGLDLLDGVEQAAQEGYELGKERGVPGVEVNIKQEANVSYDRSGHGANLLKWNNE